MKIRLYHCQFKEGRNSRARRAFSLIELVVSTVVLTILLGIFSQIVGMISQSSRSGTARVDSSTQARVVFSLLSEDVQSMVVRPDLGMFVGQDLDASGKPTLSVAFYTRKRGDGEGRVRRVSLVEYGMNTTSAIPRLIRRSYGLDFGDMNEPRTVLLNELDRFRDLAKSEGEEIAAGLVGFRFQFGAANNSLKPEFFYDHGNPANEENTNSLIVSLAIREGASPALREVLDILSDSPEPGQRFADYWEKRLAELDAPARDSLRVFSRVIRIPLNPIFISPES